MRVAGKQLGGDLVGLGEERVIRDWLYEGNWKTPNPSTGGGRQG